MLTHVTDSAVCNQDNLDPPWIFSGGVELVIWNRRCSSRQTCSPRGPEDWQPGFDSNKWSRQALRTNRLHSKHERHSTTIPAPSQVLSEQIRAAYRQTNLVLKAPYTQLKSLYAATHTRRHSAAAADSNTCKTLTMQPLEQCLDHTYVSRCCTTLLQQQLLGE